MNSRAIAQQRMWNQRLWGTRFRTAEEVVAWLGAMQAQELPVAKWSVGQRCLGVDETAIDRALAHGSILRTHILRPTWHFVVPADIRWMLTVSAPRVHKLNGSYYRKLELEPDVLDESERLLGRALDGRQLTRTEIAAALEGAGISAAGLRLGYILMHAELEAVICSGAPRGKQPTYALFDNRVPPNPPVQHDDALAELARRYFTSRGPATPKDFASWASLTVADARAALEMIGSQLEHEVVDGRTYSFVPSSSRPAVASPMLDLVQGYDECIMSYRESKDVLRRPDATGVDTVVYTHAVLLDGQVVGHWRRAPSAKSVAIETSLYRPLDHAEEAALDGAIERFRQFSVQ